MSITNLVMLNVLSYTQQQSKTLLLLGRMQNIEGAKPDRAQHYTCFLILLFETALLLKRIIRGDHLGNQASKHRQMQLKLVGLRPNYYYYYYYYYYYLLILFYLYSTGAIDTLSFLIKRGAVINVIDRIGVTPLHLAARNR